MSSRPSTQPDIKEICKAILQLKTTNECKKFLRDLCTLSELNNMAERFTVAQMVNQKVPYRKINKRTGSSTATITRVAHWLHHGKGGYKLVLERM